MKKKLLITAILIAGVIGTSSTFRFVGSGPCDAPVLGAAHTGAPGEVNCTFCHSGTVNTGPGTVTFDMGVPGNLYQPGQTYTATLTINDSGVDKFGFQVTVLKNSNNQRTGLPVITDAVNTVFIPDATRDYVGHTVCGADATVPGTISYTWDWDAPLIDEGTLTAYLATLATNHNHATSGDNTYTQTIVLTPAPIGITSGKNAIQGLSVFPNPVSDKIILTYHLARSTRVRLSLIDLSGKEVTQLLKVFDTKGAKRSEFSLPKQISSGTYFLRLETDLAVDMVKLQVLR